MRHISFSFFLFSICLHCSQTQSKLEVVELRSLDFIFSCLERLEICFKLKFKTTRPILLLASCSYRQYGQYFQLTLLYNRIRKCIITEKSPDFAQLLRIKTINLLKSISVYYCSHLRKTARVVQTQILAENVKYQRAWSLYWQFLHTTKILLLW